MSKTRFHRLCVFGLLGLLLLSLTGRFLAIGDSFAVFRPHMLAALAFMLVLPSSLRWRWTGLIAALLILALHLRLGYSVLSQIDPNYSVYQKNLFFRIKDVGPVAQDIRSFENLDFVTLQEITNSKHGLMAELKPEFPYQHICPFASVGGTAVLSRWPIIEGSRKCFDGGGMTVIQTDKGHGPIWVVSTHLNWPYPHSQREQLDRLLPQLNKLDGPVIIGGDFNMVPWSYTVRSIQDTTRTRRLRGTLTTFHIAHIGLLGMPIDHVLGPRYCIGESSLRPKLGSDHHGVFAHIYCPEKP